jgi:four helix bundle protein
VRGCGWKKEEKMIRNHEELDFYKLAFSSAMKVFQLTKAFPKTETFSLTDQVRRSSRSVCTNLTEAWRKRRYEASFLNRLNDAEAEAAETQTWIRFAVCCGYVKEDVGNDMCESYNRILGKIVNMIINPGPWLMLRANQSPPPLRSSAPRQNPIGVKR